MKLKPEIKKLWVDALRSGRYKQGYNDLRDSSGGHCCLGVLVEELGYEIIRPERKGEHCIVKVAGEYRDSDGVLPKALVPKIFDAVPTEFEVDLRNPKVKYSGVDESTNDAYQGLFKFSELNDDCSLNFKEIADIIEEQL